MQKKKKKMCSSVLLKEHTDNVLNITCLYTMIYKAEAIVLIEQSIIHS